MGGTGSHKAELLFSACSFSSSYTAVMIVQIHRQ
jgi:hypothetical protein